MSATPNQLVSLAFSGITTAKARVDANYIRPGSYWLQINKLRLDKSRKDQVFLAVEMTVIHCFDERIADQPPGRRGHISGESVTHMMMKKHDSFLGNVKAMLVAILGIPADQITEAEAAMVCGDSQPLTGTVVEVNCRNITTRAGNPFTSANYAREVPTREVLAFLTDATIPPEMAAKRLELKNRLFPNNWLEKVVEAEAASAAA